MSPEGSPFFFSASNGAVQAAPLAAGAYPASRVTDKGGSFAAATENWQTPVYDQSNYAIEVENGPSPVTEPAGPNGLAYPRTNGVQAQIRTEDERFGDIDSADLITRQEETLEGFNPRIYGFLQRIYSQHSLLEQLPPDHAEALVIDLLRAESAFFKPGRSSYWQANKDNRAGIALQIIKGDTGEGTIDHGLTEQGSMLLIRGIVTRLHELHSMTKEPLNLATMLKERAMMAGEPNAVAGESQRKRERNTPDLIRSFLEGVYFKDPRLDLLSPLGRAALAKTLIGASRTATGISLSGSPQNATRQEMIDLLLDGTSIEELATQHSANKRSGIVGIMEAGLRAAQLQLHQQRDLGTLRTDPTALLTETMAEKDFSGPAMQEKLNMPISELLAPDISEEFGRRGILTVLDICVLGRERLAGDYDIEEKVYVDAIEEVTGLAVPLLPNVLVAAVYGRELGRVHVGVLDKPVPRFDAPLGHTPTVQDVLDSMYGPALQEELSLLERYMLFLYSQAVPYSQQFDRLRSGFALTKWDLRDATGQGEIKNG